MCKLKKGHIIKHIANNSLNGTDNVISSNPRFKDCQAIDSHQCSFNLFKNE